MYTEHVCFQPVDNDQRVWRYMDFPKFIALVLNKTLFFTRADQFEDPWEGCYPDLNRDVSFIREVISADVQRIHDDGAFEDVPYEALLDAMAGGIVKGAKVSEILRNRTGVSCWHLNDHDSELFWKIYAGGHAGIAIETSFGRLKEAFNPEPVSVYIGTVSYVDYREKPIPFGNQFFPILHKRLCYEYERELRAVVQEHDPAWGTENLSNRIQSAGFQVKIDLERLIERVMISPCSAPWFCDLVQQTLERLGMKHLEIQKSDLLDKPSRS